MQARREWDDIIKGQKKKKQEQKLPTKTTFSGKGFLHKWGKDKYIHKQTKADGVNHH